MFQLQLGDAAIPMMFEKCFKASFCSPQAQLIHDRNTASHAAISEKVDAVPDRVHMTWTKEKFTAERNRNREPAGMGVRDLFNMKPEGKAQPGSLISLQPGGGEVQQAEVTQANPLTHVLARQPANPPTSVSVQQPACQPAHQSRNQLANQPTSVPARQTAKPLTSVPVQQPASQPVRVLGVTTVLLCGDQS
ncbi:UNVERIFIED_CONTAM: hypothetical protein FKN15_059930 [Acipenser sinensis]